MTQKERDRLHWLKQAESKQITQARAAEQMQVSEPWVRKLLARKKRKGDQVVIHGLRGCGQTGSCRIGWEACDAVGAARVW